MKSHLYTDNVKFDIALFFIFNFFISFISYFDRYLISKYLELKL